jgi:predicted DNA-binding mobile mystery protein A
MSLRQLGKRMKITPQSVKEIEVREKNGSISLNVLKQFGSSLDLKLVYGFIPKQNSLEEMIKERAMELAKDIVNRTSVSMRLEAQENNPNRIRKAVKEKANDIALEMPKYLWD